MSAIAQTVCARCGAWTDEPSVPRRSTVEPCPCGGMRQVVRIIHRGQSEPSAGTGRLERNIRHRSQQEKTSRGPAGQR